MTSFHSPGSSAPRGLFGILKSWLLTMPSDTSPPSTEPPNEIASSGDHSRELTRVLVVDDNPVNLMLMTALLESRGLVPCLAADGAEAVSLACELHFDLILMDLQMPILDGLAATSAIRRFEALNMRPAVPVVAYSSLAPSSAVLATHGLNGSLNKPCEDYELEDCLLQWCATYRSAPAMAWAEHGHGGHGSGHSNANTVWQVAGGPTGSRPASTS